MIRRLPLALAGFLALSAPALAGAAPDPALDAGVHAVAAKWARIRYREPADRRADLMDALQPEADALVAAYPDRAEPLVWEGIVLSERAAAAGPLSAMGLAKQARDALRKAEGLDPSALEGGAPASLGVLYSKVPGWPIGFGDDGKARKLFEQAVSLAPQGLDAWYCYGEFLHSAGEDEAAAKALRQALAAPAHPDRPVWDAERRREARELLGVVEGRS